MGPGGARALRSTRETAPGSGSMSSRRLSVLQIFTGDPAVPQTRWVLAGDLAVPRTPRPILHLRRNCRGGETPAHERAPDAASLLRVRPRARALELRKQPGEASFFPLRVDLREGRRGRLR